MKKSGKVGCLVGFLMLTAFIGIFAFIFLYSIKLTEIYRCAVAEAVQNPKILEIIGAPVEPGFFALTSSHSSGNRGERAQFNFTLSGPKGSGRLYVGALRDDSKSLMTLTFEKDGQSEIVRSGTLVCE